MDAALRDKFIRLWTKYFNGAALPICFYYTNDEACRQYLRPEKGHTCLIGQLNHARNGETLCVDKDSIGCPGGRRYLGFSADVMPDFEYFLSCGIPGKLEGERYKKSPGIVLEAMKRTSFLEAPARHAVFKRWDTLDERDEPDVVIFFATGDVLSGLFTLSNFDEIDPNAVIAPFGAGCATITQYPYLEKDRDQPRSVMGMLDVSARPFVPGSVVSFATPMTKFARMIDNMEESFLITGSWDKVRRRIGSKT
jgi:hypothetical protein